MQFVNECVWPGPEKSPSLSTSRCNSPTISTRRMSASALLAACRCRRFNGAGIDRAQQGVLGRRIAGPCQHDRRIGGDNRLRRIQQREPIGMLLDRLIEQRFQTGMSPAVGATKRGRRQRGRRQPRQAVGAEAARAGDANATGDCQSASGSADESREKPPIRDRRMPRAGRPTWPHSLSQRTTLGFSARQIGRTQWPDAKRDRGRVSSQSTRRSPPPARQGRMKTQLVAAAARHE